MSLSRSAVERANPPPRQKSCGACIKAKRRCDYGQPACVRCAQRNLNCVYSSSYLQYRSRRRPDEVVCSDSLLEATPDVTMTFSLMPSAVEEVANSWNSELLEASFVDIDIPGLVSTSSGGHSDPFIVAFDGDTQPLEDIFPRGSHDVDALIGFSSLSPMCSQIGKDTQGSISGIIAARLQYAIDEIKRASRTMVLETRTPWYHPQLFKAQIPRSMLDAHCSCALYMAKNTCNAQDILRSIEARVEDLLNSPVPTSSQEILARVQSLLLYQIIRIFDNDFRVFTTVEKTALALEDATLLLGSHLSSGQLSPAAQNTLENTLPLYSLEETKTLWMSWIFMESARRTLTTALFFIQLHRLLSGTLPLYCDTNLYICSSWTLSAHLWNAENLFDFTIAWRNKRHFVVTDGVFSQALRDAEADDIEVFGRMLFTLLMGIDEAKAWFASKGGSL
jgi:Fungal Zn(2)-Cys(6) binuclear cluster domain